MNIIQYPLKASEFIPGEYPKKFIPLHFTAGWPSPRQTIDGWNSDNIRRGTAYVIGGYGNNDGEIWQAFDDRYYAAQLFQISQNMTKLDQSKIVIERHSVGIEICNWGPLTPRNGKFFNYVNQEVPSSQVVKLTTPFKGYQYWHDFSDAQIQALSKLLPHLMEKHNIPANGIPQWVRGNDGLNIQKLLNLQLSRKNKPTLIEDGVIGPKTRAAMMTFPNFPFELHPDLMWFDKIQTGIYTHCNFDGDRKLDIAPLPKIIKLLSEL